MSAAEVLVYFVLLLLAPLAFMGAMVFGVVKLTHAENRKRRREELARQATSDSGEPQPEDVLLRVHISKGMTLWGLFLSICLTGFGLAFLYIDPVTALVIGWWSTLAGLALLYSLLKQLLITQPWVVLTTAFIEHAGWPFKRIPWSDIKAAHLCRLVSSTYLNFEVEDPSRYLRQMGWFGRNANRFNRMLGCSRIYINLTPLKVDPARILDLARQHIHPQPAGEQSV